MSRLATVDVINPNGDTDQCPKIIIDGGYDSFTMLDLMKIDEKYAFNAWIKSDASGHMSVHGIDIQTNSSWQHVKGAFTATTKDLVMEFSTDGSYYIYHPQLEIGDIPTDWTPSPDDVDILLDDIRDDIEQNAASVNQRFAVTDELLAKLENLISTLVQDENGESLMTQTADGGWTFSMAQYNDMTAAMSKSIDALYQATGDTDATVQIMQEAVNQWQTASEYVKIRTYEDQPCIELGEGDSDFKLRITNTRIMFMDGGNIPTYIDTSGLVTENITISGELRQGNWIWKQRSNGNYGLQRKG